MPSSQTPIKEIRVFHGDRAKTCIKLVYLIGFALMCLVHVPKGSMDGLKSYSSLAIGPTISNSSFRNVKNTQSSTGCFCSSF